MLINNFIQQLADHLKIAISQNEKGHANISLGDILVEIQSHQSQLVFYSFIDHFSDRTFEYEQQLKQAMSWTYGWCKSASSITVYEQRLAMQTVIELSLPFERLLEELNSHCQLTAQIQQLELQPIEYSQKNALILP